MHEERREDLDRIGRYRLCFELASGGMATVYLARAQGVSGCDELVALKRIHPHLVHEPGIVRLFLDEARIASLISHPNVCSVFDFGQAEGEHYIAMEYLVGEPLARIYQRVATQPEQRSSPLLPFRAARIISDACEGLHAAHELKDTRGSLLNVVHSDVCPHNLFVGYDGITQIMDFGVASAHQHSDHSAPGQIVGTFPFMAPEQMTAAVVDRRVDVWGVGVVLWELLTLRPLFEKDTDLETMYAVLSGEIPPPSRHCPAVPRQLDSIVLRALDRNPDERWQTTREFGEALNRFLSKESQFIGANEISDWMIELFPKGMRQKEQLMRIARMVDTETRGKKSALRRNPLNPVLLTLVVGALAVLCVIGFGWG